MMEYWDYVPIVQRIFHEYVIPRVAVKIKDYILELYPSSINGSLGLSRMPKQVYIYIQSMRDQLRSLGISQLVEKDYVLTLATVTMVHEVLHMEQDIAMCYYMSNEPYMNAKEAEVEYRSLEIVKSDAELLERKFGFVCTFMMLKFGYSDKYKVYHEADAKTWYWNTIINSVLQDYVNGPKTVSKLQYDIINDLYVDIWTVFSSALSRSPITCRIKADGAYLMSAIPTFASIVHGYCSRWTGYRVSVVAKELDHSDGTKDLLLDFNVYDCVVQPMLFKPGV